MDNVIAFPGSAPPPPAPAPPGRQTLQAQVNEMRARMELLERYFIEAFDRAGQTMPSRPPA